MTGYAIGSANYTDSRDIRRQCYRTSPAVRSQLCTGGKIAKLGLMPQLALWKISVGAATECERLSVHYCLPAGGFEEALSPPHEPHMPMFS